jgi:hypothetical protein
MDPQQLDALMREWHHGDRCVATMNIFYAWLPLEIPEGSTGVVVSVSGARVPRIHWDLLDDGAFRKRWTRNLPLPDAVPTSPDSIGPVSS